MKNKHLKVIAITLNYNQNQYTLDCINSLLESDYSNFLILLIDNGSTDENFDKLKRGLSNDIRINLERIENNIGYVGGVNHGLKEAEKLGADYFLIMNNDTLIDTKAISALVETAQKYDDNAIASGKVYNYDVKDTLQTIGNAKSVKGPLDFPAYVKNRNEKDIGQFDNEMEMGMLDDIFWLLPKAVFKQVGYYSDYFFLYGEQNDYALRAIKNDIILIYTPKAKLWHKGSITTTDGNTKSPKLEYWRTFSTLKLAFLHLSSKEFNKFRKVWVLKNIIKRINNVILLKSNIIIVKAFLLAVYHFRFWKKIKYRDTGYNPF